MITLTHETLDPRRVEDAVIWPGAGAVLTFSGVARDHFDGRTVVKLEYQAYREMALTEMARIRDEAVERWPGIRVALAHRTGPVAIREASVIISVAAPHRDEAYQASRFLIDTLKARVPIWKKEIYQDGSSWKENQEASSDS
ncbi:MAG: molybdenum cofactor biosynthesis protein MoaE [Myxococcota bacterium]|nr:molybdenum cofactor biosynthesis protein MoaE [Myxococcota bacterium]